MKEKTKPWSMDLRLLDVIFVKRSVTKCNEQNPSIWTTQCDKGINYVYHIFFFRNYIKAEKMTERKFNISFRKLLARSNKEGAGALLRVKKLSWYGTPQY